MKTKQFTSIAEVARAIGMNYDGLKLLEYLRDYHPHLALDYDFIMRRVENAQTAYDSVMYGIDSKHPAYGAHLQQAKYERNQVLMEGLEYSKFEIVHRLVDEYYYDRLKSKGLEQLDSDEIREKAIEILPIVEEIFANHASVATEEAYSYERDVMEYELLAAIHKYIDKQEGWEGDNFLCNLEREWRLRQLYMEMDKMSAFFPPYDIYDIPDDDEDFEKLSAEYDEKYNKLLEEYKSL